MIDHPALDDDRRTPPRAVAEAARRDAARDWIDGLRQALRDAEA